MKYKYIVVGAGLAGLTIAERIANVLGEEVLIIEKKSHIGGETYDCVNDVGILIGKYGPHTFHTNDKEVFDYILQFTQWHDYTHRALSFVDGKFVPFPICRKTIKELYNVDLSEKETADFIKRHENDLIDKFFRSFTLKQWVAKEKNSGKKYSQGFHSEIQMTIAILQTNIRATLSADIQKCFIE